MKNPFKSLFGFSNEKEISRLKPKILEINQLENKFGSLSDNELKEKTNYFVERIKNGSSLEEVLPEAFCTVREAAKREIGQRHFDVQLIGGMVLHQGKIAEMKTGEGKTLVATLPLYLNALEKKGAHLITVNDYLAKFQGEWMGRIYDRLGLTTGVIQNQGVSYIFERGYVKEKTDNDLPGEVQEENLRPCSRQEAYAADITYGTNNEFGFDYLRDNMAQDKNQLAQRDLHFAIVDEVDSILIDEARTPLIISAPAEESGELYAKFAKIVPLLKEKVHFEVDEKARAVSLTDEGVSQIEKILNLPSIYESSSISLVHHLEEALKAEILFKKDKDYLVKDGEVIIVDEFTGRLMPGRRFSEGLHQAIEAKEGVEIKKESDTLATISFQNLFRLYKKLSGMTGTAATEAEEFNKIYHLDVVEIPTNKPMVRADRQDQIYKSAQGKYQAIINKIKELNEKGQPVLVGTISVEKSEIISKNLKRNGIRHEVLNAKQHEREAKVIAQAGKPGAVTVATNMAGRGVDILLGGNPATEEDRKRVIEMGGLFVLGTERHESRRIDNQLRGRSGRQGDPGESQFFISMEDDLMRIFGGERLKNMMERLGLPEDQPIEHKLISRSIESAQRRVEGHNFDLRKHLVEYDDVMNKQREVLYKKRKRILNLDDPNDSSLHDEIISKLTEEESPEFKKKISKIPLPTLFTIERRVYLSIIDQLWVEHLNTMDQLRDSIGLRGYAQVDPLVAYKEESFSLFQRLLHTIDDEALSLILKIDFDAVLRQVAPVSEKPKNVLEYHGADKKEGAEAIEEVVQDETTDVVKSGENLPDVPEQDMVSKNNSDSVITSVRSVSDKMGRAVETQSTSSEVKKAGRNDPCPCGSGKKYKKCCGK